MSRGVESGRVERSPVVFRKGAASGELAAPLSSRTWWPWWSSWPGSWGCPATRRSWVRWSGPLPPAGGPVLQRRGPARGRGATCRPAPGAPAPPADVLTLSRPHISSPAPSQGSASISRAFRSQRQRNNKKGPLRILEAPATDQPVTLHRVQSSPVGGCWRGVSPGLWARGFQADTSSRRPPAWQWVSGLWS